MDVPFDGFFFNGSYFHISAQKIWLCISFSGELYSQINSGLCKRNQYLKELSCSMQVEGS